MGSLEPKERQDLLVRAAGIVDETHQPPAIIREAGSAEYRYAQLHEKMVGLIAERIHLDDSGIDPDSPDHPARKLSLQLRDVFGTGAGPGLRAGTRGHAVRDTRGDAAASASASKASPDGKTSGPVPIPEDRPLAAVPPHRDSAFRPGVVEEDLDDRRPPRLDRGLPAAPTTQGPVRFTDSAQLPPYMSGGVGARLTGLPTQVVNRSFALGHGSHTLRGVSLVLAELALRLDESAATRPAAEDDGFGLLDMVRQGLESSPGSFFADGREFPYRTADGRTRVLAVTARPYGRWERFAFGHEKPVKIESMQRSAVTSGGIRVNSTSLALAPTVPLGPLRNAFSAWGRVFVQASVGKQARYSLQNQVMNQTETRSAGTSRAHLDDVWYGFSVTDTSRRPVDLGGRPALADGTALRPVAFGFAVRDGLLARLADNLTLPVPLEDSLPRRLTLGPRSRVRMANTEAHGPVAHIRDWVLRQARVKEGDSAAVRIHDFFSTESFHRMSRVLKQGRVLTPLLFRGPSGSDPLGVFSVVVEAEDAVLVSESTAMELRDTAQSTAHNERYLGSSLGVEAGATVGPGGHLFGVEGGELDVRVLAGFNVRAGASRGRGSVFGGTGGVKTVGQAKDVATGLYLVRQKVTVTAPPDHRAAPPEPRGDEGQRGVLRKNPPHKWSAPPRSETFRTWSLERLTGTEARRLAGEDTAAARGTEPAAPPWLTADDPPTLGMSRVEEFTFADGSPTREIDGRAVTFAQHFADSVLRQIGRAHPGLVAPLHELNPDDPRWRDRGHFETVVNNTLEVLNSLSHQSMASALETMTTTGLRFDLLDSGPFSQGYRHVWVDAALSGRRYEGTHQDLRLRHSAPGGENLTGRQTGARGIQGGLEAVVSLRSTAVDGIGRPQHAGTWSVGARAGSRKESETGYGHTATYESTSAGTGGAHLYSYALVLRAETGGFWRPRRWMRGVLSLNVLSTGMFVHRATPATLLAPEPDGTADEDAPGVGRVLLGVPVEHTPAAPAAAPPNPRPMQVIEPSEARDLVLMSPRFLRDVTRRTPSVLTEHPFQTVSVTADAQVRAAVEQVLSDASGGSWTLTVPGAVGHRAVTNLFDSTSLTANFDQSSAPRGWRMPSVWTQSPYLDRTTALAHRTSLGDDLVARTKAVRIEGEILLGGVTQVTSRQTRTSHLFLGGQAGYLDSHQAGDGSTGVYTAVASPYRRDTTEAVSVSRSALTETIRKDMGRHVLVSASVTHEVAAVSSRIGERASGWSHVPRSMAGAAGRRIEVEHGWAGHLPEKSAHRLGLLRDGFGPVPLYTGRSWSPLPWLREHPFGSWPVNSLDTTAALREFEKRLLPLGLPAADRDQLRRLVSDRVVRTIGKEMTGSGASMPGRIGRWGSQTVQAWVGTRRMRIRGELIPVTEDAGRFRGLGHSAELWEGLHAAESRGTARARASGAMLGIAVSEGAHVHADPVKTAGPTYVHTGSTLRTVAQSRSEGTVHGTTVITTQAHGEYATRYMLRLTLDITDTGPADPPQGRTDRLAGQARQLGRALAGRRRLTVSAEADAGRLVEHFPLSLMRPDPPAGDATDPREDPLAPAVPRTYGAPRRIDVPRLPRTGARHHAAGRGADGQARRFVLPPEGFAVRRIIGLDQLHAANTAALGASYDTSLPLPVGGEITEDTLARARNTPLTRSGTGAAQSLEDGTSSGMLTAFFDRALAPDGHQVAGVRHRGVFDSADATLTLHSEPDFSGAQLLTVADGLRFEASRRDTRSGGAHASYDGVSEQVLAAGPTTSTASTGTNQMGTGAGAQEADSAGTDVSSARLGAVNAKPDQARTFLFAIPTTWLSVAEVRHHVKDSGVGRVFRSVFGNPRREPLVVETRTTVLAWIREDVARRLGLVDDIGFPPAVARAWDEVSRADKAWTAADKEYWDLRRGRGAQLQADVEAAESALAETEAGEGTPDVAAARDALRVLREERDAAGPAGTAWDEVRDRQMEELEAVLARAERASSARAALDAARAELNSLIAELRVRSARAEAAAEEYARVREGADRLTRWHQLAATEDGRLLLGGTAEPPEVTFGASRVPGKEAAQKRSAEGGAPAPEPRSASARPAHVRPPWQRPAEAGRPSRYYDAGADHRTLTEYGPTGRSRVLDLHRTESDGNGFYAAVIRARNNRVVGASDQLASMVSRSPHLPAGTPLDPHAVFRPAELRRVLGSRRDFPRTDTAAFSRETSGGGGLLPERVRVRLTTAQRLDLVRLNLRTARRWNEETADLAAALTARHLRVDLTVVHEDGSHRSYPWADPDARGPRGQVTVYRQKDTYLAAVPRSTWSGAPVEVEPEEPASPADRERRREIREGKRPEQPTRATAAEAGEDAPGPDTALTPPRAEAGERPPHTVSGGEADHRVPHEVHDTGRDRTGSLDELYGPVVPPKTVKTGEKDDGTPPQVRLNPLWYRLEDFKPALLERGGVWHYAIDEEGRFFLGSENVWDIAGEEERQRLFESMRRVHPDLTVEELSGRLNDQGVPTIAAGFDGTGATAVGPARVGGELFTDPLTGRWTIDASSRYVGPQVRPGVPPSTVTQWVRNAAAVLSEVLGTPLAAKDAEQPVIAHGAFVAGTGTEELDRAYGPLAGPKKVKERERDQRDSRQVRLNPLWYRLEDFKPALLERTSGVWHYVVDEDGEISIGSDKVLDVMTEDELHELFSRMREADESLTLERLTAALDNQGHPTVAAGFRADGTTVVRPGRISGELAYNQAAGRWELTDKSGRYMSNKIRPSLPPDQAVRWLANTARRIGERVGTPVTAVLYKNAQPAAVAREADRTTRPTTLETEPTGTGTPDLLDPATFLELTSEGTALRSLSRITELDRLLNEYGQTDAHDAVRRAEVLGTLVDRARAYAAGTRNESRRQTVRQLITTAETLLGQYRGRHLEPEAPTAVRTATAAKDAPAAPAGEHARYARAKRAWEGPVPEEVARLEQLLLRAGEGARSLVMGVLPDDQLWAVNYEGTVRWFTHSAFSPVRAPRSAPGRVMSIDLDPQSRLIDPARESGGGGPGFCGLTYGSDLSGVV
ncbi:hypothetical protein [Streptomyces sp. NPDC014676]|uniref:hypothetical protein n=1 Tax=Streptomyces sp. NPDC014676 TaxID=3364879 RepID=UPI0036FAA8EA